MKLHFENVAADFELFLDFYGMDLTLKEKLSSGTKTQKNACKKLWFSFANCEVLEMGISNAHEEGFDKSDANAYS